MKFIQRITEEGKKRGAGIKVEAVYIGLSYCMAVLENGNRGLSFIFKDDLLDGCNIPLPKRPPAGASAGELLDFAGRGRLRWPEKFGQGIK